MGRSARIFGIDAALVVSAALILAASQFVLATAIVQPEGGVDASYAHRQAAFAVIGFGIMLALSRVRIEAFLRFWPQLVLATAVGVLAVRFIGTTVNGAKSWIDLGPISLQPSEFGKVAMIIAGAAFLGARMREIREGRTFLAGLGLFAIPGVLVFVQPDFGTAQIYGYLAVGMLFFAGARWTHLAIFGGTFVVLALLVLTILPSVGVHVLKDYQVQRLTGFLDPESDAQGSNYQTIQAKIAIGAGGISGRSKDEASQVQQGFLPEPQTDYIFATLVERWGFVGGAAVLGLYAFFLSRLLAAVGVATTTHGRLIAGGVAMLFFSQLFINVGMVVGVLPVTGVPMPMFSYGGSSLWTSMAALGLVFSVLRETETAQARYTRRTGRPVGGYGSLRATGDERRPGRAPRGTSVSARSPLVGGTAKRRRRRPSRG